MKEYSKDLVEFIEQNRMKYTTLEMAKLLKERFNKDITTKALRKYYYRHNLDYKKIYKRTDHKVWSKPIGTESNPDKNGLVRIKINDKQWQYKQRYIYEKYYWKIPKGHIIIFLDGDKTNFDIENLYAVPKNIARTFYILCKQDKLKDKELTETGLLIAKIKEKINRRKYERKNI